LVEALQEQESDEESSDDDLLVEQESSSDDDNILQEEEKTMAPTKNPVTPRKRPPPSPKNSLSSNMSPLNHGVGKKSDSSRKFSSFSSSWVFMFALFADDCFELLLSMQQAPIKSSSSQILRSQNVTTQCLSTPFGM
jgi:hypothetical protein